jgi:tetratricopeptide (TPR) repeat protein
MLTGQGRCSCVIRVVLLGAVALTLSACGTPHTKKVRIEANSRMNAVNAQLLADQAKQAYEGGQFEKALKSIDDAIGRSPEIATFHVQRGRILLEMHRLEASLNSFHQARELNPNNADAAYFSGIIFQRWQDNEKSYESYRAAMDIDPENTQYVLATAEGLITLERFDAARQLIHSKRERFPHNAAMQQLLGQIAMMEGDAAGAARHLSEARLMNPDDNSLLEELMHAQFAAGQYARCLESAKQLQGRTANDARGDLLRVEARCLTHLDRGPEARSLYLQLTQIYPADASVWTEFGLLALDLGDHRRVAQCSTRITALAPERHEGYMLGAMYEFAQGDLNVALSLIEQAAERSPNDALPHLVLGRFLEKAGDVDGAYKAYAAALRAEPDNRDAQRQLARLDGSASLASAPDKQNTRSE